MKKTKNEEKIIQEIKDFQDFNLGDKFDVKLAWKMANAIKEWKDKLRQDS